MPAATTRATDPIKLAWEALAMLTDPEIPVVTLRELALFTWADDRRTAQFRKAATLGLPAPSTFPTPAAGGA